MAGELGGLYGHAFSALAHRRHGWQRVRLPRLAIVGSIVLALLALGFLPVRLSALAPAEIGARDALAVKSPLTGAIDTIAVRPSQPVSAGDLLFDLDATALRSEYEASEKNYQAALAAYQQSAQLAVTDDKAKAEVVRYRGEAEAMAVALNFGAEQLARARVSAPRDGVAVFSDVNALTGKAVTLGELVMTIADPDKVQLVIQMPAGDQIPVAQGASVEFYPDAAPFTTYTAQVETVAYRAEITPSGVLAFRVVAQLTAEEVPPLGMLGSARIYAGEVPLAYAIFRRPLATLRQWLGV